MKQNVCNSAAVTCFFCKIPFGALTKTFSVESPAPKERWALPPGEGSFSFRMPAATLSPTVGFSLAILSILATLVCLLQTWGIPLPLGVKQCGHNGSSSTFCFLGSGPVFTGEFSGIGLKTFFAAPENFLKLPALTGPVAATVQMLQEHTCSDLVAGGIWHPKKHKISHQKDSNIYFSLIHQLVRCPRYVIFHVI